MNKPIKEYADLTLRYVEDSGFCPILFIDGVEIWRGEWFDDTNFAMSQCIAMLRGQTNGKHPRYRVVRKEGS
jgi:hypothetical protein